MPWFSRCSTKRRSVPAGATPRLISFGAGRGGGGAGGGPAGRSGDRQAARRGGGEAGGARGGPGGGAGGCEKGLEMALAEEVAGGGPFLLAGQDQLIEIPAGVAVGKDKRTGENRAADGDGAAASAGAAQRDAIEIAVGRVGRIGAGAFAAGQDHSARRVVGRIGRRCRRSRLSEAPLSRERRDPRFPSQTITFIWTLPI